MADARISLRCPKCEHDGARYVVSSVTVATFTCLSCAYAWSVEIMLLPPHVIRFLADAKRAG